MVRNSVIVAFIILVWLSSWGGSLPSPSVLSAPTPAHDEIEQTNIFNESEPNNARNRANRIPAETRYVMGAIDPAGDIDYFSFTANVGDYAFIWIDTTPSTTSQDSSMRLMFGNQTVASDDDDGPNPQASGLAAVRLTRAGTYAIEVKAGRANETINGYRLFLCVLPNAIKAEREPNGIETATPAGNISSGVINPAGDIDVWSFPASEKDTLAIGLDQTGQSVPFDALLELRGPSGMLLQTQNNNGAGQGASEFINILSLPATGTYTLSVMDARMNMGRPEFDYLMNICLNGRPLRRAPIADAGPDVGVFEGVDVVLDGSESRGLDGELLEYEWTQVQGRQLEVTGRASPSLAFTAPMQPIATLTFYEFELKVTTPFGLSSTNRVTVRVSDRYVLKDDTTANRVLLNLAAPEFVWTTPTNLKITGLMKVLRADDMVIDLVGDVGVDFAAGASLDERSGKAVLTMGNQHFSINDTNFDDSQDAF